MIHLGLVARTVELFILVHVIFFWGLFEKNASARVVQKSAPTAKISSLKS